LLELAADRLAVFVAVVVVWLLLEVACAPAGTPAQGSTVNAHTRMARLISQMGAVAAVAR